MTKKDKNRPIKEFLQSGGAGGTLKAAVFRHDGENGARYSVRVQKIYKDGDEWERTDYFSTQDLPALAVLATRTSIYCESLREQERRVEKGDEQAA